MVLQKRPSTEGEVSMNTITMGVDLAKQVFSVCEMAATGHVVSRRDLGREAFALWLAQVPVGTVVAMEACTGAHHWARRCLEHGGQPRLMAAQFVSPFRKSHAGATVDSPTCFPITLRQDTGRDRQQTRTSDLGNARA